MISQGSCLLSLEKGVKFVACYLGPRNASKSLFVLQLKSLAVLLNIQTDRTQAKKRQRHCSRKRNTLCFPPHQPPKKRRHNPCRALLAVTHRPTPNSRLERRGTTFSPSPPHRTQASFASSFNSSLRNPNTEQSFSDAAATNYRKPPTHHDRAYTMAPPPSAEIPLAQRLQKVASTLQCTSAIAAPDAGLAGLRDRMADFVCAIQLPGSLGTSTSSESLDDSCFVAQRAGTRAGGHRLEGNHLVNFG